MNYALTLGAYWNPRRESVEQCANRFHAFMRGIAKCDEAFSHWYRRGRTRKDAVAQHVDIQSREQLLALLDAGRNRRDIGGEAIEELGFNVGLWNGAGSEKAAGLSITCGLYSELQGVVWNCINLDFPEELGELAESDKASQLLALAATCWEPDWAGIFSVLARNTQDFKPNPFVDWMLYVPQHIGEVPSPSSVTHLENGGSLIIVQPTPPVAENHEDQDRIHRIEEILRR